MSNSAKTVVKYLFAKMVVPITCTVIAHRVVKRIEKETT